MVDIIILLILVFLAFLGYKKGFLRTLTGVLSIFISSVFTLCLSSPVAAIFEDAPVYSTRIISAIAVFVIVRVLIYFLMKVFGIIRKLPLIGAFDGLLGAALGLIKGILIVYLLMTVVSLYGHFNPENGVVKIVNQSEFAQIVYNNNVFFDFIYKD